IRASTQWAFVALGLVWLVAVVQAWRRERHPLSTLLRVDRSYSIFAVGACAFVLGMGYLLPTLMVHPLYKLQGDRLVHPFWRSMYYSLQANPYWGQKYGATVDGASGDEMPVFAV